MAELIDFRLTLGDETIEPKLNGNKIILTHTRLYPSGYEEIINKREVTPEELIRFLDETEFSRTEWVTQRVKELRNFIQEFLKTQNNFRAENYLEREYKFWSERTKQKKTRQVRDKFNKEFTPASSGIEVYWLCKAFNIPTKI